MLHVKMQCTWHLRPLKIGAPIHSTHYTHKCLVSTGLCLCSFWVLMLGIWMSIGSCIYKVHATMEQVYLRLSGHVLSLLLIPHIMAFSWNTAESGQLICSGWLCTCTFMLQCVQGWIYRLRWMMSLCHRLNSAIVRRYWFIFKNTICARKVR